MKLYMSPAVLILLLGMLTVGHAHANPSVSSDAGQSNDNSESETIKRDKSLSADKSRGNRVTHSDSADKASEKSLSRSHQNRVGKSADDSNSASIDININGLLLQEFVKRYETTPPGNDAPSVQMVFAECRPLTGIMTEYPIFNSCPSMEGGHSVMDMEAVVPMRLATRWTSGGCGNWGVGGSNDIQAISQFPWNPANPAVGRYARCRIIASSWLAEAAERASTTTARSEREVVGKIQSVFSQMDADEPLFLKMRQDALDLWQHARCAQTMVRLNDFKKPALNCGIFSVEDQRVSVNYRETLSSSAIAGQSFKIAINSSDSNSAASDDSVSNDARVSASVRESDTLDRFSERKKTASMSKSHSMDTTTSDKVDTSSGASIQASPKE